jgi:hypothetical protein
MISSASDTGTWGAHADTGTAGSDARHDPEPRCSGTPAGHNADFFSADANTGINGKGNCREYQRRPDDNNGGESHHDFSSFPVPSISTRAAFGPMDIRLEQARSRA